ncbi:hypothetical protein ASF62_11125 [Leifsonia sp. Leaf325]|nr:hypothetical protein ASF62_11125 [Leifsonia sp. Leaf325]
MWSIVERDVYHIPAGWKTIAFERLWGICIQSIRHSRAYLILLDAGFEREAFTNARAALEHAITAQWVFHRHDGLDRLAVEMIGKEKQYYSDMAVWLDDAQLAGKADAIDVPTGAAMPKFMQILREVDDGEFLETTYANLSLPTHVRAGSQTEYWQRDGDTFRIRFEPHHLIRYPGTHAAALAAMFAVAILMELMELMELTEDHAALVRIDAVSEDLLLAVSLRRYLPEDNRRHGTGGGTPWEGLDE